MSQRSIELRRSVLRLWESTGWSYAKVGAASGVGESSVKRWVRRYRETGDVLPREAKRGRKPLCSEHGLALLGELVEQHPDATLAELAAGFAELASVRLAISTVHRALRRLKITRKKRRSMPPNARRLESKNSERASG
jgi:transposase